MKCKLNIDAKARRTNPTIPWLSAAEKSIILAIISTAMIEMYSFSMPKQVDLDWSRYGQKRVIETSFRSLSIDRDNTSSYLGVPPSHWKIFKKIRDPKFQNAPRITFILLHTNVVAINRQWSETCLDHPFLAISRSIKINLFWQC